MKSHCAGNLRWVQLIDMLNNTDTVTHMSTLSSIQVFKGDLAVDDRGSLAFVNEFSFFGVKRFYQVENFSTNTIRAFHGHMKEGKYVYVTQGSVLLCAVPMSNIKKPSKRVQVERFVLSDKKPQIVFIPPGFANGFRSLTTTSKVLFFSTATLEESKGDDFRFPHDYWGPAIWEVENR